MDEEKTNTTTEMPNDAEFDDQMRHVELQEMIEKADNAVAVAVAATAATGAIPIPFADAPVLIAEQVTLMASICAIFKINVKKALAFAAIGTGGATIVGKTIATNLLKFIPGVGTIAGGAVSAGTAGVVTLAMGKAFIELCKAVRMGKLSEADITSSKGKNMLKAEFKKEIRKK